MEFAVRYGWVFWAWEDVLAGGRSQVLRQEGAGGEVSCAGAVGAVELYDLSGELRV